MMTKTKEKQSIPEGWSCDKLGDYLDIQKGKLPKAFSESIEDTVPYLSIKFFDGEDNRYAKKDSGVHADLNDLLVIGDGSGSGRMYRGYEGLVSSTFLKISSTKPEKISNDYLEVLFNHLDFSRPKFRKGGAIPHFDFKQLKGFDILIPPPKEQQKIAEMVGEIDEVIKKTKEVINATEKLKKGLMQKLFSKGEKVRLGDIGKVSMCKRVFRNETTNTGDIPFYKIGTFGKEPDSFISQQLFDNYKKKFSFPKEGDVLLSASGTIGRKVIYDGRPAYFQDSNIVWLEHDESKVLNSFLYYIYDTVTWQTEGSTIKRLYNSIFLKTEVPVPSIDEQKQTVDILSSIDEKIAVNKKLLAKQTELKKGLMQDLLSGVKRVKV